MITRQGGPERAGWRRGVREGLGAPGLVIFGSFMGFGSLVHGSGIGLVAGLASSLTCWALPGQIAMVELYGIGASLLVNALAVWLTNTRLMPMTIVLMPQLRTGGIGWRHYLAAHFIAITSWAVAMRRCPVLDEAERFPYFIGLSVTLWLVSCAATATGFALAGSLPPSVTLGLVFLNPCYFMLLFASDLGPRVRILALVVGGALGPLLHLVNPDWGLLVTGLVGGTLAFLLDRWWRRRREAGHG
jgi:predicted branched-subunit amino acid permease